MNTVPPNTPSVSAQLLLKFSSIALTALLAQSVYAGSTNTTCEMINPNPPREFVCDTFGDGATLVSQTWSLTSAGTILGQTTGLLAVRCGGGSSVGYQFIASLSDGMTDTGSGSLPCGNGGGSDFPGPVEQCIPVNGPCPEPESIPVPDS
ncbi:MAG: hypothetical protein KKC01_05000 [Gammaproteobacteria bacterium]|nr:hypothetical protein [Gammaproteobacteria bacterium]